MRSFNSSIFQQIEGQLSATSSRSGELYAGGTKKQLHKHVELIRPDHMAEKSGSSIVLLQNNFASSTSNLDWGGFQIAARKMLLSRGR